MPVLGPTDVWHDSGQCMRKYACAGVGDKDACVWLCYECCNALCRRDDGICMPPLALANGMWLGREHILYQNLTLGTRMMLGKGRACWRKLILGSGNEEEKEKGMTGNSILLAQAQADLEHVLPPTTEAMQDSLVVLFARSVEQVRNAQMLSVCRQHYVDAAKLRKQVCSEFVDTCVDEIRTAELPEEGVPAQLMACAVHVEETKYVQAQMQGPASSAHPTCGAPKEDSDEEEDEESESCTATELREDPLREEKPIAETVIGVNHDEHAKTLELMASLQTKLEAAQGVARKLSTLDATVQSVQASENVPSNLELRNLVVKVATASTTRKEWKQPHHRQGLRKNCVM